MLGELTVRAQRDGCVFVYSSFHNCPVLTEDRAGQQVLLYTVFQVLRHLFIIW